MTASLSESSSSQPHSSKSEKDEAGPLVKMGSPRIPRAHRSPLPLPPIPTFLQPLSSASDSRHLFSDAFNPIQHPSTLSPLLNVHSPYKAPPEHHHHNDDQSSENDQKSYSNSVEHIFSQRNMLKKYSVPTNRFIAPQCVFPPISSQAHFASELKPIPKVLQRKLIPPPLNLNLESHHTPRNEANNPFQDRPGQNSSQKPISRPRFYATTTSSRYCHICGRGSSSNTTARCSNTSVGLCRKVICQRCLLIHDPTNASVTTRNDLTWKCTHCTDNCPPTARCHQYAKNNLKRRIRNLEASMDKKSKLLHQPSVPDLVNTTFRNEFLSLENGSSENMGKFYLESGSPLIHSFENFDSEEQRWGLDFSKTDMLGSVLDEASVYGVLS